MCCSIGIVLCLYGLDKSCILCLFTYCLCYVLFTAGGDSASLQCEGHKAAMSCDSVQRPEAQGELKLSLGAAPEQISGPDNCSAT